MNSSHCVKFFTAAFWDGQEAKSVEIYKVTEAVSRCKMLPGNVDAPVHQNEQCLFQQRHLGQSHGELCLDFSRNLCGELVRTDLDVLQGVIIQLEGSTESSVWKLVDSMVQNTNNLNNLCINDDLWGVGRSSTLNSPPGRIVWSCGLM